MTDKDASFEDGAVRALNLAAETAEDVPVISALAQDALFMVTDVRWQPRQRRLAFLLNRFRWEDAKAAETRSRPYERVRSLLVIGGVLHVSSQGIDRRDPSLILSLLEIAWRPGQDAAGRIELTLAGDGAIAAEVEDLDLMLKDVTRPYLAPSGLAPQHAD